MSKKIKILGILFFSILILIILKTNVNAASASISASKTSINLGETVTITTTINGASWDITLSGAIAQGYADTTDDAENSTKTYTYSYKPTSVGTHTINLTGNVTDSNASTSTAVSDELSINVVQQQTEPPANNTTDNNSSSNNNKPTTQEKSSEARLRDFGIIPNDFSGFKRDTYEYNVEVPNNVAEVEVYARTLDSNAKIKSGTGKISLKEGQNKAEVVVVAEDGKTTKTYTLNITRQSAETPAEPETEPTTQPTTEPTTENTNEEKLGLSSLTVNQMNLKPNFSTDTYEYTIELTQDINSLEIEAKSNKDTAIVEIFGNENLQQGENLITIIVSDTSSEENTIYQITVNKNLSEKEVVSSVDWLDPATWGFKQYLIVGTVIVLIIIIIIAIILKIKLSKMDDEDDIEFPGVKELDKAMSEHQELTNSEEENKKEVKNIEPENYDTKQKLDEFFNNEEKESTPKKKGKHF